MKWLAKRTCKLLRIPHGDHFHDVLDCGDSGASLPFDDEPISRPSTGGSQTGVKLVQSVPLPTRDQATASTQPVTPSATDIATPQAEEWTLQSPEIQNI